jgi:hypothetical protein
MGTEARKSWLPTGVVSGVTPSIAPAEAVGVEAAWERFRTEAAAVDARDVKTFTANASVVLHNVSTGVGAVMAPFDGVLRGIVHRSVLVQRGMKIGDVDPRAERRHCFTVSDKALAIGGGVLEAILVAQRAERPGDGRTQAFA